VVREGAAIHTLGATYRLQLGAGVGFAQAARLVPYVRELGVTDLYVSPIFRAAVGSTHGYDVVDPSAISTELGGEEGLAALTAALRDAGMGLLVDWVPNHMGIASPQNRYWDDVLENGLGATHADFFDIDWEPQKEALRGKVLLPILGDPYGRVLERGELRVVWEGGLFRVAYFEKRLPLDPASLVPLLQAVEAESNAAADSMTALELESIVSAFRHLPSRADVAPERRRARAREKEVEQRRFMALVERDPTLSGAVERALATLNGKPGVSTSFDALDALLDAQSYRLASWRVASEEINYRRFFDVNDMAALHMETPKVLEETHTRLFELIERGTIQGLRVDHVDGLYDPRAYFEAVQRRFLARATGAHSPDDLVRPLAIIAEKILEPGETLPAAWPVDGTTGYEFGVAARGLFVDAHAEPAMTRLYQDLTGDRLTFEDHVYDSKHDVLWHSLASEVNMLARQLERIASRSRLHRDFTLGSLTNALVETIAAFDVYRTYARPQTRLDDEDEREIEGAIARASDRSPETSPAVFAFLEDILLLRDGRFDEQDQKVRERFAMRFQQLTGPVMAKAVEDTAFYRYTRLLCLNEVGGDPARFGETVAAFHAQNAERARSWPLSMTNTSTHDSKRGEDAAARIAALSEIPDAFAAALRELGELAAPCRSRVSGRVAPSRTVEYAFYQAVVGAWPLGWDGEKDAAAFVERVTAYMRKHVREAKRESSWTHPKEAYEAAVQRFVETALTRPAFVRRMRALCDTIAIAGATNGLATCLLRLCSPGVPDTYQGAELWNQALVDPDNRRAVDFETASKLLSRTREELGDRGALCTRLLEEVASGRVKQYVTHATLAFRREQPRLFLRGDYAALVTSADDVVAFTRAHEDARLVCVVPRLWRGRVKDAGRFPLGDVWGDVRVLGVPAGRYTEVLTGRTFDVTGDVRAAELFASLPVALLRWHAEGGSP
jgi:(1->4)-alpha-D-glucan 1-alpha-D-glucosylmutase